MRLFLITLIQLFVMTLEAQTPSMNVWTAAWHEADPDTFKNIYSKNAVIFPPNKPTVKGNTHILEFMRGGLGKVDVLFEPKTQEITTKLAFEFGTFKDVELKTGNIIGKGNYAVTWKLENNEWKILCHTWSMPDRK